MEAAREGWMGRSALEERLSYAGKALGDRLTQLTETGLLARRPAATDHRSSEYTLTSGGQALLALRGEAVATAVSLDASAGERAAMFGKWLSDRWDRMIVRVILDGPQPFGELLRLVNGLARSWGLRDARLDAAGLRTRLRRLAQLGLVAERPTPRRDTVLYGRGPQLWQVARLAAAASLWCCIHTPQRIPPLAGDLSALMEMVQDEVRVDANLPLATIILRVQPPDGALGWPDAPIDLEQGRIQVLRGAPSQPTAYAQGSLRTWCEALLSGEFDGLKIDGDHAAAHGVLTGTAAILRR